MGRRTKVFALDQKLSKCRTTRRCIRPHINEVFDATTRWLRVVRPWLDDKSCRVSDVRFGSKADIWHQPNDVCFTPQKRTLPGQLEARWDAAVSISGHASQSAPGKNLQPAS